MRLANCDVGSQCNFHQGVCIGQDGFGFTLDETGGEHQKKPQELRVSIADSVEIGALAATLEDIPRPEKNRRGVVYVDCEPRPASPPLRLLCSYVLRVGANTTIDRGSWRNTSIGSGCKIDNLVQIGHNVALGKGCVIGAQTGIGGSTTLGNMVFVGAQCGLHQHITIGDGARIAAKSGVMRSVPNHSTVGKRRHVELQLPTASPYHPPAR